MKLSEGFRNKYMGFLSQLSTPLYSQPILRIYAATNGLGGVPKVTLSLDAVLSIAVAYAKNFHGGRVSFSGVRCL